MCIGHSSISADGTRHNGNGWRLKPYCNSIANRPAKRRPINSLKREAINRMWVLFKILNIFIDLSSYVINDIGSMKIH